jgi:hypothetical protein
VRARIQSDAGTFVHVNCADGAGYVDGTYVVLKSEQPVEVIEEEPILAEDPALQEPADGVQAPTGEEPVAQDPVVAAPVAQEPVFLL